MKANERTFYTIKYPEAEGQSTLYDHTDREPTRTLIQLFQYSSAWYRNSIYATPTQLSTLTPWGKSLHYPNTGDQLVQLIP